MALDSLRSTLNLGEAAVLIVGASLGIEDVRNTAADGAKASTTLERRKRLSAASLRKCTCTGNSSPPPCYTCTFNLQHSPPPYQSNFRTKSMKIADDLSIDGNSSVLNHCDTSENSSDVTLGLESSQLKYSPADSISSDGQIVNNTDNDSERNESRHIDRIDFTMDSSRSEVNTTSGARSKIPIMSRHHNVSSNDINSITYIPEELESADRDGLVEHMTNSSTINTKTSRRAIGQISPVRERLGSISAYISFSTDSADDKENNIAQSPTGLANTSAADLQDSHTDLSSTLIEVVNRICENEHQDAQLSNSVVRSSHSISEHTTQMYDDNVPENVVQSQRLSSLSDQTHVNESEDNSSETVPSPLPSLMIIPQ